MAITDESPVGELTSSIMCTFCQKPTADVKSMVAGPGVYICDACVDLCVEIIANKPESGAKLPNWEARLSDDELLSTLPQFQAAGAQIERQLAVWVRTARTRGITWTRIGAALGMTRQSAWERFSGEE
jgi:ClpX C4-type zinc finger